MVSISASVGFQSKHFSAVRRGEQWQAINGIRSSNKQQATNNHELHQCMIKVRHKKCIISPNFRVKCERTRAQRTIWNCRQSHQSSSLMRWKTVPLNIWCDVAVASHNARSHSYLLHSSGAEQCMHSQSYFIEKIIKFKFIVNAVDTKLSAGLRFVHFASSWARIRRFVIYNTLPRHHLHHFPSTVVNFHTIQSFPRLTNGLTST